MSVPTDPACVCGCADPRGNLTHPVSEALAIGDVDRAFSLGLLTVAPCPACSADCVAQLEQVQDERRQALAARERYRQRAARLELRRLERERKRAAAAGVGAPLAGIAQPSAGALPAAAAAALARAKAKAAARAQATTPTARDPAS